MFFSGIVNKVTGFFGGKPPAIGIDLGTSCSCVSVFQNGKVEIIPNELDKRTTPSYVAFTENDRLIGEAAKEQAKINPKNTIFDTKRMIGRRFEDSIMKEEMKHWPFEIINNDGSPKIKVEFRGEEKTFFPEEISSMILCKMKETAEAYLKTSVSDAVISVPANFNNAQRLATKKAAQIAGLNVLQLLSEPVAAAITYVHQKKEKRNKKVLILDVGGGTTDVTILNIKDGTFRVLSTSGNTHLGGKDIDYRLAQNVRDYIEKHYKKDISGNDKIFAELLQTCEEKKKMLSFSSKVEIKVDSPHDGIECVVPSTRDVFEDWNNDIFNSVSELIESAFKQENLEKNCIDDILLIGGSTRIPKLQRILQASLEGKKLNKSINPDEAVAYGAAVWASVLSNDKSAQALNFSLRDITPSSFNIEMPNGEYQCIFKNQTVYPLSKSIPVTVPNCVILRICETTCKSGTSFLGYIILADHEETTFSHEETTFSITFRIDKSGILTIENAQTQSKKHFECKIIYEEDILYGKKVELLASHAKMYAEGDKKEEERQDARECLENYILEEIKKIKSKENTNDISVSERTKLDRCQEMLKWLQNHPLDSKEEYETKLRDIKLEFRKENHVQQNTEQESVSYFCNIFEF